MLNVLIVIFFFQGFISHSVLYAADFQKDCLGDPGCRDEALCLSASDDGKVEASEEEQRSSKQSYRSMMEEKMKNSVYLFYIQGSGEDYQKDVEDALEERALGSLKYDNELLNRFRIQGCWIDCDNCMNNVAKLLNLIQLEIARKEVSKTTIG